MYLHVLNGLQAGSYIPLSIGNSYHVSGDLDADIYLEANDGQSIDFKVTINEKTVIFDELHCEIKSTTEMIRTGKEYGVPIKFFVADIICLFSLSAAADKESLIAEDINTNEETQKIDTITKLDGENITLSEETSFNFIDTATNEEILEEIRQKILNRSFILKCYDKSKLYFHNIRQLLGYWFYLILSGLIILAISIFIIIYQIYRQDTISTMEETKFNFKHKVEQAIMGLPSKYNNFYVTSTDGDLSLNGIVANINDLKQVNEYFKIYQPNLKIKMVVFEQAKGQILKILADNNITMGLVNFDINTATINLMGLASSMDDIDNAEIAIDNKFPGVGQMNANKMFLLKDVNGSLDAIFNAPSLNQKLTVNKDYSHGVILVSGYLAQSELNNLKSTVNAFNQKYYPIVQIKLDVKNIFAALPFQIIEVHSGGDQSWIVTNDGTRLFEGGFYKGFSVLSISDDAIVLKGKFILTISTEQLAQDSINQAIESETVLPSSESKIMKNDINNLLGN